MSQELVIKQGAIADQLVRLKLCLADQTHNILIDAQGIKSQQWGAFFNSLTISDVDA